MSTKAGQVHYSLRKLYHKYRGTPLAETHERVSELFVEIMPGLMAETEKRGSKLIDPTPFLEACFERYGRDGLELASERIQALDRGMKLSPHSITRYVDWHSPIELRALFSGTSAKPEGGTYIDQRFID